MGEWRPIESAPLDGSWVLVSGGTIDCESMDNRPVPAQWTNELNGQMTEWHWQWAWFDGGYYGWYENPTHWMPLPEPPDK